MQFVMSTARRDPRTGACTCDRLATPPSNPSALRSLSAPLDDTTTRKQKALDIRMLSYNGMHVIAPGVLPFAGLFLPLGFTRFRCHFHLLGVTRFRYQFLSRAPLISPQSTVPDREGQGNTGDERRDGVHFSMPQIWYGCEGGHPNIGD